MKKLIKMIMCLSLLLCTACSSATVNEDTTAKEDEPLYYSDEIKIVTKDLSSIEELKNSVLAVQETFDKEYSDYVIEQL